jgi:hypothetical protein
MTVDKLSHRMHTVDKQICWKDFPPLLKTLANLYSSTKSFHQIHILPPPNPRACPPCYALIQPPCIAPSPPCFASLSRRLASLSRRLALLSRRLAHFALTALLVLLSPPCFALSACT